MRELKTRQQISDWITQSLQTYHDCADATVGNMSFKSRCPTAATGPRTLC